MTRSESAPNVPRDLVLHCGDDPARKQLLETLVGQVFHLTTERAYEAILREGKVGHNREGRYPLNGGSENSFGRLHGFVCLFDLRSPSPRRLALVRRLCDFLDPAWQAGGGRNPVYLLLGSETFPRLVPNEAAFHLCRLRGRPRKYLPGAECWYPGDLPLGEIAGALHFPQ
jgi:hypothetical protein